jgi:cell fate regulator YaaT (PSP1 superfamily)
MSRYLAAVRYGLTGTTENFLTDEEGIEPGQTVIIRTDRGIDYGEVVSPVSLVEREIKGLGEIMRVANEKDTGIIQHIREVKEPEERTYCQERIDERKLPMKLAGIEHLFSGEKIIFYFLADGRVDFRELVKDLARRYRTRIEMRQIGVRDEARLLADYEHCGQELCCRTFLSHLEPVTMRMAKTQKTTLDPGKISGHCGRLMCCLRFEDEVYSEFKKSLPKRGDFVRGCEGCGRVQSQNIIKRSVTVVDNDGTRQEIHADEIVEHKPKGRQDGGRGGGRGGGGRDGGRGGGGRDGGRGGPKPAGGGKPTSGETPSGGETTPPAGTTTPPDAGGAGSADGDGDESA